MWDFFFGGWDGVGFRAGSVLVARLLRDASSEHGVNDLNRCLPFLLASVQ